MEGKIKIKSRILSVFLIMVMLISMLPSAAFAGIMTEKDELQADPGITVTWKPQQSSVASGGEAKIHLRAGMSGLEETSISIALTQQEADALTDFVGGQQPEGFTLKRNEDKTAALCFTLKKGQESIEKELTVSVPSGITAPFTFDVTKDDISVTFPDGAAEDKVQKSITASPMDITASFGWRMSLQAQEPKEDYGFSLQAASSYRQETGALFTQLLKLTGTVTLPEGLGFPDGNYTYDEGQILAGQNPVVTLENLPQGMTVSGIEKESAQTLHFVLQQTRAKGDVTAELNDMDSTVLIHGNVLVKDQEVSYEDGAAVVFRCAMEALPVSGETKAADEKEASVPAVWKTDGLKSDENQENMKGSKANSESDGEPQQQDAGDQINIYQYREEWKKTLYWVDNNNEASARPEMNDTLVDFWFSLDGGEYQKLTEGNMTKVGLTQMPGVQVTSDATHYYLSVEGNTLPSEIQSLAGASKVSWKFEPAENSKYEIFDVTADNIEDYPSISNTEYYGWYYVLKSDFTITVEMRDGDKGSSTDEFMAAIKEQFRFRGDAAAGSEDILFGEVKWDTTEQNGDTAVLSYSVRKYNLDGSRITYLVEEIDGDGRLDGIFTEGDDYYAISYDNTNAPNFGGVTTEAHSGGKLILTLTGKTDYTAEKQWLDPEGVTRPGGKFELWRYRKGQSYASAAPVRDRTGEILTVQLKPGEENQEISFTGLDKYDPDGYQYLYVTREYLDGDNAGKYDQVFGEVNNDSSITDTVANRDGEIKEQELDENGKPINGEEKIREDRNTYIYNGGVLSNRRNDTVTVGVTKIWKAAAFQADFEETAVKLVLQSRAKGSEDAWENTDTSVTMSDFYSEHLQDTRQVSVPKYDIQGQELEYQWVEVGVYQGIENDTQPGDGDRNLMENSTDGSYQMTHQVAADDGNGAAVNRSITYQATSETTQNEENGAYATKVTNSLDNKIIYTINKQWFNEDGDPADPPAGTKLTFSLYRSINGSPLSGEEVAQIPMDGVADGDFREVRIPDGSIIKVSETQGWQIKVEDLDEFDEEGRQWEYAVLETEGPENYIPTYTTTHDPASGNYTTNVINAPGTGNWIMVSKEWIDDGDSLHRKPVTVKVYNINTQQPIKDKNGKEITAVLNDGNSWNQRVDIGDNNPEEVYIVETQMGETTDLDSFLPNPLEIKENAVKGVYQIQARYHRYEVSYRVEKIGNNIPNHIVTNCRLGNIDLTVQKNWVDRVEAKEKISEELNKLGGDAPGLYMQLEFSNDSQVPSSAVITRNRFSNNGTDHDTVTLVNEAVKIEGEAEGSYVYSQQKIDFNEPNSTYYFHHLPKYLSDGVSVQYTVREVWLDPQGNEISKEELKKDYPELYEAWLPFATSYEQTKYITHDDDADKDDEQEITVTNRLSQTKDIQWHKQWQDAYRYENGQRPDIFLDIYQVTHNEKGGENTPEIYQRDCRWTYNEDEDLDESLNKEKHWHALLENVPKYDEYGYEIMYYAVEKTHVNIQNYDYIDVEYAIPAASADNPYQTEKIGTVWGHSENSEEEYNKNTVQIPDNNGYALKEEGTFINRLAANVTIVGQKLWSSLPAGYPDEDLPAVDFTLYQNVKGAEGEGQKIASLTVNNWSKGGNGTYEFTLRCAGDNTGIEPEDELSPGQTPLPKYDEDGNIYEYTLKEVSIKMAENGTDKWDNVYRQPVIHTYVVENVYEPKKSGALTAVKYLKAADADHMPAVTMKLMRTYTGNDRNPSDPEEVDQCVLTFDDAEQDEFYSASHTFENLPYYAPNGSPYQYYVVEDKTHLGGFDTWVTKGDVETADIANITYGAAVAEKDSQVKSEAVDLDVDNTVTFVNIPKVDPETVAVTGKKIWKDYDDLFGVRPPNITLKLYRQADAQPGQSNGIAKQEVPENLYEVDWDKATDTSSWTYTIKGKSKDKLARYAPNGMPWKYSVQEVKEDSWEDYYTTDTIPASAEVSEEGENAAITLKDLTNSMETGISITKDWVDREGRPIEEDYLGYDLSVTFALQVREKGGIDWQDAETYLKTALGANYGTVMGADYSYEQTITGRIDDDWQAASFQNLPGAIKKDGTDITLLEYRIVETEISYVPDGSQIQDITVEVSEEAGGYAYEFLPSDLFSPAYPMKDGGDNIVANANGSYTSADKTVYNMLNTTMLSVTKKWEGDNHNIYGSRPRGTGSDWEVSFLIQKKKADNSWKRAQVYGNGSTVRPLIIKVSGSNTEDEKTVTVSSLPEGEYRAVELQPGYDVTDLNTSIVSPDNGASETYYGAYTAEYDFADPAGSQDSGNTTTVTNTLETVEYSLTKEWVKNDSGGAKVSAELQYQKEDGSWTGFKPAVEVELDGEADAQSSDKPYYEDKHWHAVWKDVPSVMPGSETDNNGKTIYRIVEADSDGFIRQGEVEQDTTASAISNAYKVTNMTAVSLKVEKRWEGTAAPNAEVGLYRYVDGADENTASAVTDSDGKNVTAVLNKDNGWTHTFTGLAKYTETDARYIYIARELKVDGKEADDQGRFTYTAGGKTYEAELKETKNTAEGTDDFSTVIINQVHVKNPIDITVKKVWLDENTGLTRPEKITLTLYAGDEPVEDGAITLPRKTNILEKAGDFFTGEDSEWTHTFKDLPKYDENGEQIAYTVKEAGVTDDYEVTVEEDEIPDEKACVFTVTNTALADIPVEKRWDNISEDSREAVTVGLYRQTAEQKMEAVTGADGNQLTAVLDQDGGWKGSFEKLPVYDAQTGVKYAYSIQELTIGGKPAKESGYRIRYSTGDDGTLIVTNSHQPAPTPSDEPTPTPSGEPTPMPSDTPTPSGEPTPAPSDEPISTPAPTKDPGGTTKDPVKRPSTAATQKSSGSGRKSSASSPSSGTSQTTVQKSQKDVKTGDETGVLPLVTLALSAVFAGLLLRIKITEKKKKDN